MRDIGIALLALIAASLVRRFILNPLETRIVWVTFYPAVMFAALYGSWFSGLLVAVASCFVAIFAWPLFVSHPFIKDHGDWLGLFAFFINSGLITIMAECTRRSRLRAIESKRQADFSNRAKSLFLANMSHELRTPLNAILGFTRLLQADPTMPTEPRANLDIINRSGEHLLNLINDVLDMAKIESGQTTVDFTVCDLPAMTEGIVPLMRQRAEAKGLNLVLELSSDLPQFIQTDAKKLRQVIFNLVGNAIKFTNQGEVTLRLRPNLENAGKQCTLTIEVEDTGIGIAESDKERIFEPFIQLTPQVVQQGTGLGLTITRHFVELLGATLQIESVLGKGSIFRINLPVEVAETPSLPSNGSQKMRLSHLKPGQPEYRILIVEDKPENWMLLQRLLEQTGFLVRVCENGEDGVAAFESWQPHFIWMDWRLPGIDGLESIRRIRALKGGAAVKIAVLSASAFQQDHDQVMASGADDYVTKPFYFWQIYDCMAKHLGVYFLKDETEPLSPVHTMSTLDHNELATLPSTLQDKLTNALVLLDPTRIDEVIVQISILNPQLGSNLKHLAAHLKYTTILQSLRTCKITTKKNTL